MPITALQSSNMAAAQHTFFSKQLLKTVAYALVWGYFGQRTTVNAGYKVHEWRQYANITLPADPGTTYLLTEGTTPADSVTFTVAAVTATPLQYGTFVQGTDVLKATVIDPLLAIVNSKLSQLAGESLDLIARAAIVAGTNIIYAGTATTVATIGPTMLVNYAELIEVIRTMKDNGVTACRNGRWCAIITHATWGTLMKDRDVKDAITLGQRAEGLFSGKLGTFLGIDFYESKVGYSEAGTLVATVHSTVFFGDEAYGVLAWAGMGLQSFFSPPGGLIDPLHQYWRQAWKASFVAKILNQNFMIILKHATN